MPEELADELSEVDAAIRDEEERELASIPANVSGVSRGQRVSELERERERERKREERS